MMFLTIGAGHAEGSLRGVMTRSTPCRIIDKAPHILKPVASLKNVTEGGEIFGNNIQLTHMTVPHILSPRKHHVLPIRVDLPGPEFRKGTDS
jgi:hypothetical protein